ncbi:acyl-CoA dehydrogenase family protein [Nonomuraea sediminis]|uniref:acyl-CoA dehydrogenase family protein n=1 Tax=Nonomuraea sediminis TaxID=2835864 RepID=UPI001BDBC0CD|nr:acyl-CoA dehydrogenase family protein [Nonomuraea sediminis]
MSVQAEDGAARLAPEELAWAAKVREMAATAVAPYVREMDDRARFDDKVIAALVEAGLMGIEVPSAYGGAGGGLIHTALAIEELARVDPAVAVLVDVQNALLVSALVRHGSGDQKRRYLPRLAAGTIGAYAISEEQAGSDAFALATTAEPDGDGFALTGRKCWITNAAEAGLLLVFARTGDNALTAFLVERDAPGLTVGPPISKLGIRASSTCEVVLDRTPVGRRDVLGGVGGGSHLMVDTLNIGKAGIAAQLVGAAQGALDLAVAYARERRQFGERIADFQAVRFPLAALAARIAAARALVYDTVALLTRDDAPEPRLRAAAMAKYVASEVAEQAASHAVETHGGNGFTTGHLAEKFYRDTKVGKIYEGTSNMQFRTIAATLFPS